MKNYFPDPSGWSACRRNQPEYQHEIKAFAETIHGLLCPYNHMDQCSWEYEKTWDGFAHKHWFERAKSLLNSGAPKDLILDIIKEVK